MAIRRGRKFIGIELKPSYYRTAITNLKRAENEMDQLMLDFNINEVPPDELLP
jgi:DNA modification methylase